MGVEPVGAAVSAPRCCNGNSSPRRCPRANTPGSSRYSSRGLASVTAGETALSFPSLGAVLPQVNAGRLRAIAITSTQRSALLPKVATISESGYPDYAFTSWVGVLAPAGTPPAIVAALNAHIVKAMRNQAVIERLAADGNEVVAGSPEQFSALIKTELSRWAKVVKASGMKPE